MGALENKIDGILKDILSEQSFEDFLEDHDLTPTEVLGYLYSAGLIDLEEELQERGL